MKEINGFQFTGECFQPDVVTGEAAPVGPLRLRIWKEEISPGVEDYATADTGGFPMAYKDSVASLLSYFKRTSQLDNFIHETFDIDDSSPRSERFSGENGSYWQLGSRVWISPDGTHVNTKEAVAIDGNNRPRCGILGRVTSMNDPRETWVGSEPRNIRVERVFDVIERKPCCTDPSCTIDDGGEDG